MAEPGSSTLAVPETDFVPLSPHGTRYYWRVRAFNTLGEYSNWSAVYSLRGAVLPPVFETPTSGSTEF